MKKFLIILLILGVIGGGIGAYFFFSNKALEENIEEIKKGWYVEVLAEEVNIREKGSRDSKSLAMAHKGDVYEVVDVDVLGNNSFWYKIKFDDNKVGFIYNSSKMNYLNDYNNPTDIASPTLKFFDKVYYVNSIDDITYDHLEVWDDKPDYEVTHKVYHEVGVDINGKNIDQYWIQYTVTDGVGNSDSKVQKIEFNEKPSEEEVYDFSELER